MKLYINPQSNYIINGNNQYEVNDIKNVIEPICVDDIRYQKS